MQAELEAKFLNIDHQAMRQRLRESGAELVQPERLMRRCTYDLPDGQLATAKGWLRLRDEGDKITLAYKQLEDRSITGTKEAQVTVDSFDNAKVLLESAGFRQKSYQETRRESWALDGCEIELDQWPWIKPFMEIEGPNEDAVRQVADKLGLDWARATHGSVEVAYQAEYDVTEQEVDMWPSITFTAVPADLAAKRR